MNLDFHHTQLLPALKVPMYRRARMRPRALLRTMMGVLACATLLFTVGCGYRIETMRLPEGNATVYLDRVENLTTTGELDVLLRQKLRGVLMRNSSSILVPHDEADVILNVRLHTLNQGRTRDLSSTDIRGISYQLIGDVTLIHRRSGKLLINRAGINVGAGQEYDKSLQDTPAIRGDGINDVLIAFSEAVERTIYSNF